MSPRRFEKYEKRNWNNFFFLSSLSVRCFFFVRPFVHSFALEFRVVIVLWYCRPDNWVRVTLQQYANQIYSTRVFLFCLFLVYFPVIFFVLLLQCKQNRIEERSEHNEQEQKISSWSLGWLSWASSDSTLTLLLLRVSFNFIFYSIGLRFVFVENKNKNYLVVCFVFSHIANAAIYLFKCKIYRRVESTNCDKEKQQNVESSLHFPPTHTYTYTSSLLAQRAPSRLSRMQINAISSNTSHTISRRHFADINLWLNSIFIFVVVAQIDNSFSRAHHLPTNVCRFFFYFFVKLTFMSLMICWKSVPMTPPSRSKLISIVVVLFDVGCRRKNRIYSPLFFLSRRARNNILCNFAFSLLFYFSLFLLF